jgi:hypothetical protein
VFTTGSAERVTFGRQEDCKVCLQAFPGISRYHFFVWFEKDHGWQIMDGDGTDTLSTNGTWCLLESPIAIEQEETFKAGRSIYTVRFCV